MNLATYEPESFAQWYAAWKARAEANAVTRMRFAGLRFIVKLRRGARIRMTMGYDEVRV